MAHSSAATHLNVTRESRTFLCRFVNESAEYRIFICYATRYTLHATRYTLHATRMTVRDVQAPLELRGYAAANGLDCNDAVRAGSFSYRSKRGPGSALGASPLGAGHLALNT
jgi:hypothetical protein